MTAQPIETDPNPGCPNGPRGFHLYDVTEAGQEFISCVECGTQRTEGQILTELARYEPPIGSVVMVEGPSGTAWQRFYASGNWKSMHGHGAVWDAVLGRSRPGSRVWLVYVPPARYTR